MPAADARGPAAQGVKRKVKVRRVKPAQDLRSPDAKDSRKPVLGPPKPEKLGPPANRPLARRNLIKQVKPSVQTYGGKPVEKLPDKTLTDLARYVTASPTRQRAMKDDALRAVGERTRVKRAKALAPVLDVLEETTRPLHAVAGAEKALIHNLKPAKAGEPRKSQNVLRAAVRGLQNKDKTTYSDVLDEVGVKNKVVKAVAGTALDIAGDPLTYVGGGVGSVAKKAATEAATEATKKALKAGLTREQAERFGRRAATQAAKRAPDRRGVTVTFAGKEVPGVRRATAKVGSKVRAPQVLRKAGSEVNPRVTPPGVAKAEYDEIRQAARTARAKTSRGTADAQARAAALRDKIGPQSYTRVIDAIESGKIGSLPDDLREAAVFFRSQMRYARRQERQAGINVGERKGYVPHVPVTEAGVVRGVRPGKTVKPGFAKARKEQRTLRQIRLTATVPPKTPRTARTPGLVVTPRKAGTRYVEDVPALYSKRMTESSVARAKSEFNQRIAGLGPAVKRGDHVTLKPNEAVYHVSGPNLRRIDAKDPELQRLVDTGDSGKGGRYVILNEQAIEHAYKAIIPQAQRTSLGTGFDRMQAIWKFVATQPNPGFHLRNLAGDFQNAYLGQSGRTLPKNTVRAVRTLKAAGRREEAQRTTLKRIQPKAVGTKIDGKRVSYDDLAREAKSVGAIRSGFVAREIPELAADPSKVKVSKAGKVRRTAGRQLKNREDLFRLATYIAAREKGLSPEKAAARMADFHFDYADLTPLERRVLRRIMPFYTFSARNIPLQFRSFFAKPGKYAQYQKIREEVAKAFGLDLDESQKDMAEWEQRSAPLAIKWKGHDFTLSLGPSGLPMTDLNELPTSANPLKTADEWMNRAVSLVTPGIKTPVEIWANFSFFFRDQIERETGPLVAAPSFVAAFPDALKKELGVVPDYVDRRTGKQGWGWPAKVDYVSHILPGPFNYLNRVLTPSERKQQTTGAKTLAYAGLRATPIDATSRRIDEAYERRSELEKERRKLNQRGIFKENATPEWQRLSAEITRLTHSIEDLREKRGDKVIPARGRPKSQGFWDSPASSSGGSFWDAKPDAKSSGSFWDG